MSTDGLTAQKGTLRSGSEGRFRLLRSARYPSVHGADAHAGEEAVTSGKLVIERSANMQTEKPDHGEGGRPWTSMGLKSGKCGSDPGAPKNRMAAAPDSTISPMPLTPMTMTIRSSNLWTAWAANDCHRGWPAGSFGLLSKNSPAYPYDGQNEGEYAEWYVSPK